jgi:molybdopterin-containing oxidoreductase family iron-sulfur binding subunit
MTTEKTPIAENPSLEPPDHWLSLEHLEGNAAFLDQVGREFPALDPLAGPDLSRRRFLELMSASLALMGLTSAGCRRWPRERLAPFAQAPQDRAPGISEHYASVIEMDGIGNGVVVTSYEGRPNKIEGNPLHPGSLGATTPLVQGTVLDLYDPDRSRHVLHRRSREADLEHSTPEELDRSLTARMETLANRRGKGLAVVLQTTGSPTVHDLVTRLVARFPEMRVVETSCLPDATPGTRLATGQNLRPVLHPEKATVLVLFDADLLGSHPDRLRLAREWARGRRSADEGTMSRMLVCESSFSLTGTMADLRLATRPEDVERTLAATAHALGVPGVQKPSDLGPRETAFASRAVDALRRAGKNALVAAGSRLSPEAQAIAHKVALYLGTTGTTVTWIEETSLPNAVSLADLTAELGRGDIDTLILLGGNPAHDAPSDIDFAGAVARAEVSLHLSSHVDETTSLCTWHAPLAHFLEAWGDARSWDGTVAIAQPLILPLFTGRSCVEMLAVLVGDDLRDGMSLVRRTFETLPHEGSVERAWRRALHDGVVPGTASPGIRPEAATTSLALNPGQADGLCAVILPHPHLHDGRFANNAWLQELPHPLTKAVWDNPALLSPADAERLGLATGDVVTVATSHGKVEIPCFVLPGQPEGVVGLSLGFGRTRAGRVGSNVGTSVRALRRAAAPCIVPGVTVTRTGRKTRIATTQDHHAIDPVAVKALLVRLGAKRESGLILREATLERYRANPHFVHDGEHGPGKQLYEPPSQFNDPHAWGMAIDLTTCIGCSACTIACQAENNIPVVGKEEVLHGREMHWIRIDRYFKGTPEDPDVVHQPVACQHCENAPCEQVCPVAATVHDTEGLNTMVYNRCVGTRYCSNNCPYKVRRFNFFDYHSKEPNDHAKPWLLAPDSQQKASIDPLRQLLMNPEVTVRMRGVMEKCTYCVQRISAAKTGRRTRGEEIRDGDVVPACQQVCPTEAIVFGDLNDPGSKVRQLHESARSYGLLDDLQTRPRNRYLARISNPGGGSEGGAG